MIRTIAIAAVVLFGVIWLARDGGGTTGPVEASAQRLEWSFQLSGIEDMRHGAAGPSVLGVLLDVSFEGSLELDRILRVCGEPRLDRKPRVAGRLYRWELRDAFEVSLFEGEFFDRTEQYTVTENGACERRPIGRHAMLLRVPGDTAAQKLVVSLVDEK